jgi:glucose/arabinose dehydrogenase
MSGMGPLMKYASALTVLLFAALSFACGRPPEGKGNGETGAVSAGDVQFRVETVAVGLSVPWSIAFLPDGRILVNERAGRIRVIQNGQLRAEPLATIEGVEASGESGLMGLTLHPQFSSNHLLYIAYAYRDNGRQFDRIVRYREAGDTLTDPKVIIEAIPAARFHAGCRIRFGPDNKLYITTGDATDPPSAQRLDSLGGKTLRLNDDGSVPSDNPFVSQSNARPEVWSLGHRNSQGLDFQPGTGLMFQTEHGPSGGDASGGGDEVNTVEAGKNYGWPIIHHTQTKPGLESPLLEYTPAVAPASAMFYRGTAFRPFQGNFFFGCLRGETIVRVELEGRKVIRQERLLEGKYGRIRDVVEGPDGAIYFSTSNRDGRGTPAANDDRILKLVPAR